MVSENFFILILLPWQDWYYRPLCYRPANCKQGRDLRVALYPKISDLAHGNEGARIIIYELRGCMHPTNVLIPCCKLFCHILLQVEIVCLGWRIGDCHVDMSAWHKM